MSKERLTSLSHISNVPVWLPHSYPSSIDNLMAWNVQRQELLKQALAVGKRLRTMAIFRQNTVGWLGMKARDEARWTVEPTDMSLYQGNAGIAFFLAYLGYLTEQDEFTMLARAATETIQLYLKQWKQAPGTTGIGSLFELPGSAIYLFTHLGVLWNETSFFEQAEELIVLQNCQFGRKIPCDFISGIAGYLSSLLSLYSVAPSSIVLTTAIRCGESLVAQAQPMERGIGWDTMAGSQPPAGISHGVAGIALSLLRLASITKQERFRQAAQEALRYERTLYDPELQNWPVWQRTSLQEEAAPKAIFTRKILKNRIAWCHGAPGIGLARLASLALLDDKQIHDEIRFALQTTLSQGFGHNHSLCHGDCGNIETLLVAAQILDTPLYYQQVYQMTAILLKSIDTYGFVTGIPLGGETFGLFTGIAGTGYELLRLLNPERIPSVLLLAPPNRSGKNHC